MNNHTHMYKCVLTCIYTDVNTLIQMSMPMHIYICKSMQMRVQLYVCSFIYLCMHMIIHLYIYMSASI